MKKFFKVLVLLFTSLLLLFFPSSHAYSSEFTWEVGTAQYVEIENNISKSLDSIKIQAENLVLDFNRVSIGKARTNYQVIIPVDFPRINYVIVMYFKNGTSIQLSTVKVVEQSNYYDPLTDYLGISLISITLFTLITLWNIGGENVTSRSHDDDEQNAEFNSVDSSSLGKEFTSTEKIRKSYLRSLGLDEFRNFWSISLNRYSPMLSRLVTDGSYLQYFLGNVTLLFPILGTFLGFAAHKDIVGHGYVTTPSLYICLMLIILGSLDAGSAFISSVVFGTLCFFSGLFESAFDVRTFLGLSMLWFSPALIANSIRSIRKSRRNSSWWERSADFVIAPLLTGWTSIGIVKSLNGMAHLTLPLSDHANLCGSVVIAALFIRYLLEELASYRNENYIAYVSPRNFLSQDPNFRLISWCLRAILYVFFSISFLGMTWHVWVSLAAFMVPFIINAFKGKFPNSTLLFQFLPVGIPCIIIMNLFGKFYVSWVDTFELAEAEKSRTVFLLMSIPGLLLTVLKAFGRSPKLGEKRWYTREKYKYLYRILGPMFLLIAIGLTLGAI